MRTAASPQWLCAAECAREQASLLYRSRLVQSSTKLESGANNHDWASSAHRSWWRAVAPTTVASTTTVTTPRTSAWGLDPETSQGALVCCSLQQRPSLIWSKFDRSYDYSQFARVRS